MSTSEEVPSAFESDRRSNQLTARLLLHHFLGPDDLGRLEGLGVAGLSQDEKLILVFVREVGAIDNATYRDLTGTETLRASAALRHLCELGLLEKRGQSTATYYLPAGRLVGAVVPPQSSMTGAESSMGSAKSSMPDTESSMDGISGTRSSAEPAMAGREATMVPAESTLPFDERRVLLDKLSDELRVLVDGIGPHAGTEAMRRAIRRLCVDEPRTADELALLVRRNPDYLKTRYLKLMLRDGELHYTIPDMPKHPHQAYRATERAP